MGADARSLVWRITVVAAVVALGQGCGGASPSPSSPSPAPGPSVPAVPPPPSDDWVMSGRVVTYGTNVPVAGARVAPAAGSTVTTGAGGEFELSAANPPSSNTIPVRIEAPGHVTRELHLTYQTGRREGLVIDLIPERRPFSLDFYRTLARNASETPGELEPLWRLTESPKFYVRTVDQNKRPIEPEVLDVVLPAIRKAVRDWTGGRLSVTTLETGVTTRDRRPGWITVDITRNYDADFCGRALVGATDGWIELVDDRCHCGSVKISGAVVAHEVGHALGFWHTESPDDVMYPYNPGHCPPGILSGDERYHSALAYSRTRMNLDPDADPPAGALMRPGLSGPPLIVN